MKALLIVPTYNGGEIWKEAASKILKYSSLAPEDVYIVDSESKDDSVDTAVSNGFNVKVIDSGTFNHGGTRTEAINNNCKNYDIAILMTQDAIPLEGFSEKIIQAFEDPLVACAYGRQLPHVDANPLAYHARMFNYPSESVVSSKLDIERRGIKTAFTSNSFCAYRISHFQKLGGFPDNTILSEDMYFAAKAILSGYKVAYVAEAQVRHSHNYSSVEEFRRYFDIGVFHSQESWIRNEFGGAGGEGKKYLKSEFLYLMNGRANYIPKSFINNIMKFLGYKLGQNYKILPSKIIKKFSMHKKFWI